MRTTADDALLAGMAFGDGDAMTAFTRWDLVDELAGTADQLLLLAPASEPPVGFESRVAARFAGEGRDARLAGAAGSVSAGPRWPRRGGYQS